MTDTPDHLILPGVACEACGSLELRVICPGSNGDQHDLIGRLTRPARDRAWCSIPCARRAGFPWLAPERTVVA